MKQAPKSGIIIGLLVGIWNISCFSIASTLSNTFSLGIPAERLRAYSGLLGIVILITGLNMGIKALKARNGNVISFGQAAKAGILISLITAVVVAFFSYLYCTVINPGYTDFMVKEAEKTLAAAGKTPAEIGPELQKVRVQFGTVSLMVQSLIAQSAIGSVSSVIIGYFIRSKRTNRQGFNFNSKISSS